MTQIQFPFEAQADLPGVAFGAMRQVILMQAKSANLDVLEDAEASLTVRTVHGVIGLRPGQDADVAGFVAAQSERWLFAMKLAVVEQMLHLMPDVASGIRWSNGPAAGSLPPNFSFVQVRDVIRLGLEFLRVTLEGEDLSSHGDDAIHFRLVQPPVDAEPVWPRVAENGSVIWADGSGALHKPVYTTRSVDHDTNRLVTDIYVHDGGRTTDWALSLLEGDRSRRVVGLVGPSGGGLMHADRVLMASDETGFPAAARLLENLPKGATGDVFLEAQHGGKCDYPIEAPEGISISWLSRENGDCLADAVLDALPRHTSSKIWFAGERGDARRLREAAKGQGREAGDLRISGFWGK